MFVDNIYVLNPDPLKEIYFDNLNATAEVIFDTPPGGIYGWNIANTGGSFVYVKFYNTYPNINVDIPKIVLAIPPIYTAQLFSANLINFNNCYVRATTGVANNDNTNPGLNQVIANIFYSGQTSSNINAIANINDVATLAADGTITSGSKLELQSGTGDLLLQTGDFLLLQ